MDFAAVRDWPGYFQVMLGKPARETLAKALELFEKEGLPDSGKTAIDLGCGEGRDTLELLARGWHVTAIDSHPMAFEHLRKRVPEEQRPRLTTHVAEFDAPIWGAAPVSLVNASFSLPFCDPDKFPGLWRRIVGVIRPGGRFAGQLFGERDSWAALPDRTHHARRELDKLFDGFVWEELREEEKDDKDALGNPKHWQVFHIAARRL
jgi:SAM-dependent methyltransferase